jgi:uncharacterized protein (TIGR02594 family)
MNYLDIARSQIGVTEIKGPQHNKIISMWLKMLNAWWGDDETPWCGVFVGYCLKESGLPIVKNYMRAKAWLEYGTPLNAPKTGCLAIFDRKGGGHVGFVIGKTPNGSLLILGGNQGDTVCIKPFSVDRVVGYRMPPNATPTELVTIDFKGDNSTNEA